MVARKQYLVPIFTGSSSGYDDVSAVAADSKLG